MVRVRSWRLKARAIQKCAVVRVDVKSMATKEPLNTVTLRFCGIPVKLGRGCACTGAASQLATCRTATPVAATTGTTTARAE